MTPTRTLIIDPVSTEFNRGSFCYLPYLVHAGLRDNPQWNMLVDILENASAGDLDSLPEADLYLIALWSEPQKAHAMTYRRFLPKEKTLFFGYKPYLDALELPHAPLVTEDLIKEGMKKYIKYQDQYTHILLSDCDMHLKEYSGQVYPMFTSYGCPNRCAFCPSSANQPRRLALTVHEVLDQLKWMYDNGHTNIHFTDEDFFFDPVRVELLCREIIANGWSFNFIALAERATLGRFLKNSDPQLLVDTGFRLLEVGLESASQEMSQNMGKGQVSSCEELAEFCPVDILWLTLTFFPGETIESIFETGKFLRKYGKKPEDLYARISTNGTEGGLGQFYQYYPGTGRSLTDPDGLRVMGVPATRLIPSYIPGSFAKDVIQFCRQIQPEESRWFEMYQLSPPSYWTLVDGYKQGMTIEQLAKVLAETESISTIEAFVSLAICARLGIIRGSSKGSLKI